jgi:hypothetical protein
MQYTFEFIDNLKNIRITDYNKFIILREFLKNIVEKQEVKIPLYLLNRYSSSNTSNTSNTSNNITLKSNKKSYKIPIVNEKIEQVKDILSKLSEGNKEKMINKFNEIKFNDIKIIEILDDIVNIIYKYSVDLAYINNIFAELIGKIEYQDLKNKIIDMILNKAINIDRFNEPSEEKRWQLSNSTLIGQLLKQNIISSSSISYIISDLKNLNYNESIINILKIYENIDLIKEHEEYLLCLSYNKNIEQKLRFLSLDVLDLLGDDTK